METHGPLPELRSGTAPILTLSALQDPASPQQKATVGAPETSDRAADVGRARHFAADLLVGRLLDTGESALDHADGMALILAQLGPTETLQAASYLVYAADALQSAEDTLRRTFGPSLAQLVALTQQLVRLQRAAERGRQRGQAHAPVESIRKMLLAFSKDLRVVLLRLASRLQTLRWHAAHRHPCPLPLAQETLDIFAPLANRLGIGQIKWELEDLSFRFLHPQEYHTIARLLDERRVEREAGVAALAQDVGDRLQAAGIDAAVVGRPKHLYSIWRKMQGKRLAFHQLMDLRALRVVVGNVDQCYAALAHLHLLFPPVDGEFDDYIAKPKPNGYQSLHTVVLDSQRRPVEIQIRTAAMHDHAEFGVAAHWAYKEAGPRGYAGVTAGGDFEEQVAQARRAVLQQLLAWERDRAELGAEGLSDRIYCFTPQAGIVDLPIGATAVDFAYALHTDLGHRCRGARVDGVMVALNTPLQTGQTVEVLAAKEGGPSLDWLNPELHYLISPRAKAKVRAWFNARELAVTQARGREAVEKVLQREGRTTLKHDELAQRLGFEDAGALFERVGKDELSLRTIEAILRESPADAGAAADRGALAREAVAVRAPSQRSGSSEVLVVGVDALLTHLARCCRPAPPDAITGYVTKGRGVAIHRRGCSTATQLAHQCPERIIPVAWGDTLRDGAVFPVDLRIEAQDRSGLLRDISEVFARDHANVIGVQTQSVRDRHGITARMVFTAEVRDAHALQALLRALQGVEGVRRAERR